MNPLLKIQDLNISYDDKPIIENVSLTVNENEILGIVGESGSGKSTLIKAIMGLLSKDGKITNGSIYFANKDLLNVTKETLRQICGKEISMIFQNAGASLCPVRTIGEQLYEAVSQHQKTTKAEVKSIALELFSKINLKDGENLLKKYPFELSGGMNQRIGIVMAMILKPKLILADEPTSALDVTVQAQVIDEMLNLRDLYKTSIIIVTHNIGVVERMADRIIVMHHGKIVERGKAKDIIQSPKDDYTKKLLSSVLRLERI